MRNCPSCQAENEDKASACFLCGQKLKKRGLLGRMFGGSGGSSGDSTQTAEYYYGETADYGGEVGLGERVPSEAASASPTDSAPTKSAPPEPEDAAVFKEQGKEHLNQGQYRLAVEANSEAIRIDPQYTDAYYNRGLAYILLGQYHQATKDFDEAISLNNQDPDAYYNRAHALFMLHQLERAIADYGRSIQMDPDDGERYVGRGAAYFEQGAFQNSIDDFDQALRLGDYPHAYANRAVSYIRLGKYAEAEEDIKCAQELGYDADEAIEELNKRRE